MLLECPVEVRNMIYKHALSDLPVFDAGAPRVPGLLRVNRQIRQEALGIFFASVTVRIRLVKKEGVQKPLLSTKAKKWWYSFPAYEISRFNFTQNTNAPLPPQVRSPHFSIDTKLVADQTGQCLCSFCAHHSKVNSVKWAIVRTSQVGTFDMPELFKHHETIYCMMRTIVMEDLGSFTACDLPKWVLTPEAEAAVASMTLTGACLSMIMSISHTL